MKAKEIILICAAAILSALGIGAFLIKVPIGVAKEWIWAYEKSPDWYRLLFAFPWIAIFWFFVIDNRIKRAVLRAGKALRTFIVWFVLCVFVFSSILFQKYDFYNTVASMSINSYGGAFVIESSKIGDIKGYLEGYPQYISSRSWEEFGTTRIISNPPGTQITFALLERALLRSDRNKVFFSKLFVPDDILPRDDMGKEIPFRLFSLAAVSAYFIYFAASLCVIPVYLLMEKLAQKQKALELIPFAVVIPSLLIFAPGKDVLQLPIFFFFWYFSYKALMDNKFITGLLAGMLFYLGLFFTMAMTIAPAVVIASCAIEVFKRRACGTKIDYRAGGKYFCALGAGFLIFAAVFYYWLHYDFVATLSAVFRNHADFYSYFPRTYSKWVYMDVLEFLVFIGMPLAVLFVYSSSAQMACLAKRDCRAFSAFFWGTFIVFAMLDVSGKNLGEAGRLWVFFMPAAAILIAGNFKVREMVSQKGLYILLLVQLIYTCACRICLDAKEVSSRIDEGVKALFYK